VRVPEPERGEHQEGDDIGDEGFLKPGEARKQLRPTRRIEALGQVDIDDEHRHREGEDAVGQGVEPRLGDECEGFGCFLFHHPTKDGIIRALCKGQKFSFRGRRACPGLDPGCRRADDDRPRNSSTVAQRNPLRFSPRPHLLAEVPASCREQI